MPELDHIFLFVPNEARARALMSEAGLRVNYARAHHGQGTRNLCACLDDMFLELIWADGAPAAEETERITLSARARGQGCPIGVSWRGACDLDCVPYAAPFLPPGAAIPVARASLDPSLPFVFRTPGGSRPIDRADGLIGDRQMPHLAMLGHCQIHVPDPEPAAKLLDRFERISVCQGDFALSLTLLGHDGSIGREFTWAPG
jgi:hypothetical protein